MKDPIKRKGPGFFKKLGKFLDSRQDRKDRSVNRKNSRDVVKAKTYEIRQRARNAGSIEKFKERQKTLRHLGYAENIAQAIGQGGVTAYKAVDRSNDASSKIRDAYNAGKADALKIGQSVNAGLSGTDAHRDDDEEEGSGNYFPG